MNNNTLKSHWFERLNLFRPKSLHPFSSPLLSAPVAQHLPLKVDLQNEDTSHDLDSKIKPFQKDHDIKITVPEFTKKKNKTRSC